MLSEGALTFPCGAHDGENDEVRVFAGTPIDMRSQAG